MTSISDDLKRLAQEEGPPGETLVSLVGRFDEVAPVLRDLLDKAARGRPVSDDEANRFFYGLHVLAAARDRQSFPALLKFLRRPQAEVDDLLGQGVTESLRRVVAGLFDGDVEALLDAAIDPRIDEFVRDALFSAATFLTWDGRIPPEHMRAFLVRFDDERLAPDGQMTWFTWVQAITLLGLRDLMPRVERVFAADRLPEHATNWREIEQEFRDAERAPADIGRFVSFGCGYADDIVETLRWTRVRANDPLERPVVNPYRDVGRNDPCPCGSGKKFKKCCLATVRDPTI